MFPMFAPTAAFAAPGFPDIPLPGIYRRLTHTLFNNIFRHGGGLLYGLVRRRHSELPPLTGWPFSPREGRITPLLFGFSGHVVPRPADWPEHAHITGYWSADPPRDEEIPAGIRRFLDAGPAPVFIGFGSAVSGARAELAGVAVDALRRTGRRGILSEGSNGPAPAPDILMVESVSHRWLFPKMGAIVHHGGAGTTGAGLRAGIPNILIPFTADQPFWAARVRELGVGPDPIPLRKLTPDRLAAAIERALTDGEMRSRCGELGGKIDAEDGVARAVDFMLSRTTD
jgi:sterol 3beta-glucosyltransferase